MTYPNRNADLAKIHIAKKQLGMDDDTYRELLHDVARVESARDLDVVMMRRVLVRFGELGFKAVRKKGRSPASKHKRFPDQSDKIRALWISMGRDGILKNSSEQALNAYVKRMTRVDNLGWLDPKQSRQVIESLKQWRKRVEDQRANEADAHSFVDPSW